MAKTSSYEHYVKSVPLNPDYEKDKNYILIESIDQLKDSFKSGLVVAWDTETTGLNPEHSEIVGFSYTMDGKTGYYCPVKHKDIALGKEALDLFYNFLKSSKLALLYNARFDIRIMEYSGYDMSFMYSQQQDGSYKPNFYDVMVQTWLADTRVPLPSLKVSTLRFLGFQPPKFSETLGSEQNFQYVPAREAYRYACFTEDTLVQTKFGLKKIKHLVPGKDYIKTSTGFYKLLNILPQGVRKIIKVTPPFGLPFCCTPDHKFAVEYENKLGWVNAESLDTFPFSALYHGGESLNDIDETVEYIQPEKSSNNVCLIEDAGEAFVFDLSIEYEHNFFLQCGIIAHNCLDAINTFNLFKVTYRFVKESGVIPFLDNSCTYILGQLEKEPVKLDTEYLISLRDQVFTHVQELEKEIHSLAGKVFNINSNREMSQVFMEQGIDTGERTLAGDMKTGVKLLNIYLTNHPDCEILRKIIEYREQFKFYNSYLKTLVDVAKQQEVVPPRFSYKLQAVPCLTKNNIVLVKDKGLISIASVVEQDYIWTQYGYKRVLWNNAHKSKDLYHVSFSNSFYIEGTSHHPVLVNKGTPTDIKLEWAILSDLKVGEHVLINHHTPNLEKTEDNTFTKFIEYLGFLTAPLLVKDVGYLPEYLNTLKDFKQNTNQAFRVLTEGIMNDSDAVMRLVSRAKPGDWVSYFKGLFYAVFETQIAQNWNSDFLNTHKFKIYSENSSMLTFVMGLLSFLGIQSQQSYNGVNFYLEFSSDQSIVLLKQLIVEEVNSPYLTNLFFNTLDYYIEYEDTQVAEIIKLPNEDTVYDIEVEDVHEYVANGVVTHNTGRLSCVTGDTLIPTILGNIPIEDLSLYEDGNEVYIDANTTSTFHTLYMGEKPVVEIHLDNGKQITATLDHRFMNSKTEWVYVNDLKVGDSLLCVIENKLSQTKIINMIPKKEVEPVWTLTVNHKNHQYLSNTLISHNCGKDGKNTYFAPINFQCLEENTLVKTDRGDIPIKNVTKDDLVWTGTRFVPCQPLGHKKKHCYKIKTLWGEIEASLEHKFFTLNYKTWEFEWHTLGECILYHYPLVRDPQSLGMSFDELYNHTDYINTKRHKRRELSLEEYKEYLDLYKDCKFDVIIESPREFWSPKMDVPHLIKTVYDLYVPEYNQFTANGYIVHNSLPKPKSVKCYGRKATQEEINQKLDVLGWMFSPDNPEWSPGKVVEGMKQKLNVRSAIMPKNPENGDYVVSIDMCFEGGSPVQTKRGYMGISEVKIGDEVYSPQGWVKVIRVMQTGIKKLIKVYPDNGGQAIYCTEDHPFIIDDKVVQAKDIKEPVHTVKFSAWVQNLQDLKDLENRLGVLKSLPSIKEKVSYIKENNLDTVIIESVQKYPRARILRMCGLKSTHTFFLKEFTTLDSVHVRPKNDIRWNNIFNGNSTPTSAYLFGYILGDGNICKRRNNYLTLNITSKDYEHLVQISNVLGDGLQFHYHEKKGNKWWTLDIPDRNLCNRLLELGISERKSTEPSNVNYEWLGNNYRHFIRGLFDSDGYTNTRSGLFLEIVGHDSYIKRIYESDPDNWIYKYTPTLSYIHLKGTAEQKKFIYEYLYRDATIWLQRKRDILDSWYTQNFGDIILPVWNITVDTPEHLIYVQGINVHQCAEELKIVTNLYKEDSWARVINSGGDLHHANSDAIFGKENYTKETRKKAKCIAGNCTVQTPIGRVYIKDLCKERIIGEPIPINTFVYTPEKFCKAKYFIYNGIQKTLLFTFNDSSTLEVTPDHIVKSNARLVRADSLKINDVIDTVVINKTLPNNKQIISIEESESEVFDLTIENKTHLFYANGFVVHNCAAFGILYGQEYQGFQRTFPEMSLDEAKDFMTKFKRTIPHIIHGQDRAINEAKRTGTVYSGFGRPCRVKHYFTSTNFKDIAFGKRTVKNFPIQGTAADVLKIELIKLWQNVFTKFPECHFIGTIHDEINFSIPRNKAKEIIPIMIKCMTINRDNWLIPLTCSLSVGSRLGDIYAMKYNFETKEFEPDWEEDTRTIEQKESEKKEDNSINFQEGENEEKDIDSLINEDDDFKLEEQEKKKEEVIEEIDSKMFDF